MFPLRAAGAWPEAIQALTLEFAKKCSITVSIGVAQYCRGESVMQTLSRADAALYKAKEAGRNRIVASTD